MVDYQEEKNMIIYTETGTGEISIRLTSRELHKAFTEKQIATLRRGGTVSKRLSMPTAPLARMKWWGERREYPALRQEARL